MGGSSSTPPNRQQGSFKASTTDDPCDVKFETDLVGISLPGLAGVKNGDVLDVSIKSAGNVKSVVCSTKTGAVVGSLAAFRGLAQLIKCIEGGEVYEALVQSVSRTNCRVMVYRP
jgi:hypothetical protein